MFDAIREARVHLVAAEVEVRLARMTDGPFADLLVKVEQARFAGNICAWLRRDKTAGRGRRNRLLLLARPLTQETAGPDRHDARLWLFRLLACQCRLDGWGRRCLRCRRGNLHLGGRSRGLFLWLGRTWCRSRSFAVC